MRITAIGGATLVVVLALIGIAFAQDAGTVVPASPWADFWADVQAPLAVFATAVLTALGSIVAYYARRFLGERSALAVNEIYRMAVDAGGGWMMAKIGAGAVPPSVEDRVLADAIEYVRKSYPDTKDIEPNGRNLANDILAAFGRLKAKD